MPAANAQPPTSSSRTRPLGALHLSLLVITSLALSACKPLDKMFGRAETPAEVCASAETMREVAKLISISDKKLLDEARHRGLPTERIRKQIDRYWATGAASIDLAILESVDETTQRIVCKGQFVVKAMSGSKLAAGAANLVEAPIIYFRQPSADGKSFIFGYEDPSEDITLFPAAMASVMVGDVLNTEQPEPDDPELADSNGGSLGDLLAEGEAEKPDFDASAYATSAACHEAASSFNDGLQCEELRKSEEDAELAKVLVATMSRLPQADAAQLEISQKRWAQARDEECEAEASAEAAVFSTYAALNNECTFTRNSERLKALAAIQAKSTGAPAVR